MADTSNRGFASMDKDKQREIASQGGKASSGSFSSNNAKASEAGKKGNANQSTEAKRKGGEHSHSN